MRLGGRRKSRNIEDRRGQGRGGVRMPLGRKGLGGGIGTIILVLAALYFGVDPSVFLAGGLGGNGATSSQAPQQPYRASAQEEALADLVAVVLADTEDTWNALFRRSGSQYREPKLVLFTQVVNSACGRAQSAMGPFYCPGDDKIYIDLSFYEDLRSRFGAPGDFAQAYVVAHEVGHHVQHVLGISDQVHQRQRNLPKAQANALSVRLELQADCLAGLWAHHAERSRNLLDQGDINEALTAAAAIGDDRLQRQSGGRVAPDSFTHGTSEQRMRWFRVGYEQGQFQSCDTFASERV